MGEIAPARHKRFVDYRIGPRNREPKLHVSLHKVRRRGLDQRELRHKTVLHKRPTPSPGDDAVNPTEIPSPKW